MRFYINLGTPDEATASKWSNEFAQSSLLPSQAHAANAWAKEFVQAGKLANYVFNRTIQNFLYVNFLCITKKLFFVF